MVGNGRRLTEERREYWTAQAVRLRERGETIPAIAKRLGFSDGAVWRWVGHIPRGHDSVAAQRREHARSLRQDGLTLAQTAATLGVSVTTIQRWMRDAPRGGR